jgi:hypothetical protein
VKLKIENHTNWSTRDLRGLIIAGMNHVGVQGRKHFIVKYRRFHGRGCQGRARLGRRTDWLPDYEHGKVHVSEAETVWLFLDRPEPSWILPVAGGWVTDLAQTIEHELMHTLGHQHRQMVKPWKLPVLWAEGRTVRWIPPKPKPARAEALATAVQRREARARKRLATLEAQHKRTAALIVKWRARVRYYDHKVAARTRKEGESC